ncbi:Hypothetical protein NTJ_10833 [Nesidiocoris tenuis]|uniref:Uncharacterized protein n=1 Tax=Nesidiocoris tenuis TaxID=355587 RepID=A0ABN7B196_9HEMI|nr:Hypothetical protein NTJ_10833 [Nesidiocoris tenuis]
MAGEHFWYPAVRMKRQVRSWQSALLTQLLSWRLGCHFGTGDDFPTRYNSGGRCQMKLLQTYLIYPSSWPESLFIFLSILANKTFPWDYPPKWSSADNGLVRPGKVRPAVLLCRRPETIFFSV